MLYQSERHEPRLDIPWDEAAARALIETIARDSGQRCGLDNEWPWHPQDIEPGDDVTQPPLAMYHGAAGVLWALRYLDAAGAVAANRRLTRELRGLLERTQAAGDADAASYLLGETPIRMMLEDVAPSRANAARLVALIEGNVDHPARELMSGAPGTLLAASFLHERTGDEQWAALFRQTAARLWSQLEECDETGCRYWVQTLHGRRSSYLGAVHGFAGAALALIRGRELLGEDQWRRWEDTIATTVLRSATREYGAANWRPALSDRPPLKWLLQFCHGAPGVVTCLARFPGAALDDVLLEAGEAIWAAGPLRKGSNLCHGTGGNGYALLALYERTGDATWLGRARAFAMHGIAQTHTEQRRYGQWRYSLWTGDLGFAIFLWDCIRARPAFPTLDVFFPPPAR